MSTTEDRKRRLLAASRASVPSIDAREHAERIAESLGWRENTVSEVERVEIEEEPPTEAMVPLLGLMIDLTQPKQVAEALALVRDAKRQLDEARAGLERILIEESMKTGTRTLRWGNIEAVVSGGPSTEYDVEDLQALLDAGLPESRFAELVRPTVTYKVNRTVIRQLLASGNPLYIQAIEKATRSVEKPLRVSVT